MEWHKAGQSAAGLYGCVAGEKAEIESHKALKEAYRAAENASCAKTEFLSNMSHDIRTPMNAIIGLTAIAGANIESQDRVVECLGKITKSSRHLLGLINEVLDMARIESGRMSLAEEDFSLSELVDNLLTITNRQSTSTNISSKSILSTSSTKLSVATACASSRSL